VSALRPGCGATAGRVTARPATAERMGCGATGGRAAVRSSGRGGVVLPAEPSGANVDTAVLLVVEIFKGKKGSGTLILCVPGHSNRGNWCIHCCYNNHPYGYYRPPYRHLRYHDYTLYGGAWSQS
jgi:hypothetical protein